MRTLSHQAAIIIVLGALAAARAEPMPPVPMLDQLVRSEHLVFEVVLGQVTLTGSGLGGRNTSATGPDRSESLQMRVTQNETQLNYQLSIPAEVFSVTVSGTQAVQVQRTPRNAASFAAIAYVQRPGRPVVLSVGSDDARWSIEAPTLWHLMLAAPDRCREHLLPMLGSLGPNWDLEQAARAIEEGMLQGTTGEALAERARWSKLVAQLADDAFARREAADRDLRAGGSAAVGYLRQLDFASLMPEQQYRVRRILETASNAGGDTVADVVVWLSGDAYAWLLLAGRDELATREAAAARLDEILGEPVAFDPRAPEAERTRQLDAIRDRLR